MKANGSLIDTNIIIKLMNGDSKIIEAFEKLDKMHVSSITAGELFFGAYKSSRTIENLKLFKEFLSDFPVLEVDYKTSEFYGKIKAQLVKNGINIPENDLWISAIARQNELALFTADSHFANISDLELVKF